MILAGYTVELSLLQLLAYFDYYLTIGFARNLRATEARWLRPHLPCVPSTHVPAGDPLRAI